MEESTLSGLRAPSEEPPQSWETQLTWAWNKKRVKRNLEETNYIERRELLKIHQLYSNRDEQDIVEWLKLKRLTIPSVGNDTEKLEHSDTVCGISGISTLGKKLIVS